MRSQSRRDTAPELELRRELWRRGLRGYRLDRPLPFDRRRGADLTWVGLKVAVLVDGCFWHGCPQHFRTPQSNTEWWRTKISKNVERDRDTDRRLPAAGWQALRVWEHEPTDIAADLVEAVVRGAKGNGR